MLGLHAIETVSRTGLWTLIEVDLKITFGETDFRKTILFVLLNLYNILSD